MSRQHGDVMPSSCLEKRCYGIHLLRLRVMIAIGISFRLIDTLSTVGITDFQESEDCWILELQVAGDKCPQ